MTNYYNLIPDAEVDFIICEVVAPKKSTPGITIRMETEGIPFIINQFYTSAKDGRLQLILLHCGVDKIPHTELIPEDHTFFNKALRGKVFKGKLIKAALRGRAGYLVVMPKPIEDAAPLKAIEGVENIKTTEGDDRVTVTDPVTDIIEGMSEEDLAVLREDGII